VTPPAAGPLAWTPELEEDAPPAPGLPPVPPPAERRASAARARGWFLEIPLLAFAALSVAFLLRTFVFQAFYIPSPSMGCAQCPVHTLEINDKILVSKISYRLHAPRRGDIVVFECPQTQVCNNRAASGTSIGRLFSAVGTRVGLVPPSTEDYIKRVIALPGDVVEVSEGIVMINGQPLVEPYLPRGMQTNPSATIPGPYVVPPDHLWVMGDNRGNSSDSRVFQAIPTNSVVGRAIVRFWPIRRWGFL
jgi:signal peptidase I